MVDKAISFMPDRSAWIDLANHMGVVHFTGRTKLSPQEIQCERMVSLCFEIVRTLASKVCEGISMHQL